MAEQLVLDTDFNITKAEAKINKLNREFNESNRKANEIAEKISELNKKLTSNEDKNFFAQKALERAETEVDKLQAKLANIDINHPAYEIYARKVEEAKEEASKWLNTCDKLDKKNKEIRTEIQKQNATLDKQNGKTATIKEKIALAKNEQTSFGKAIKKSNNPLEKFANRIKGLAKRVFIFSVITKALRSIRDTIGDYIKQDSKLSGNIAKIKSNIATIGTTLYQSVSPYIELLLEKLALITQAFSEILAAALGKDIKQMRKLANESKKVADNAQKATASFDTLQKIDTSSNSNTSDSYSNGNSDSTLFTDDEIKRVKENLEKILGLAKNIAIVFATWKITSLLSDLGLIPGELGNIMLGITSLIVGVTDLWDVTTNWDDSLHNGEQTIESIRATVDFILIAIGLIFLGIAAWPVLIIAALAIIGVWIDNYKNKIDKWISKLPKLIYELVDILYTAAYGVWDFIKNLFKGLYEIFTGDWEKGLKRIGIALLNLLIDCINIIVDAINFIIWPIRELIVGIGKIAGKNWDVKNIAIPKISRIPQMATGAVLPGGSPMLAWVNDQPKGQGYIEGSVENIAAAFEKYLGNHDFGGKQNVVLEATGNWSQFIKWMNLQIKQENTRSTAWG